MSVQKSSKLADKARDNHDMVSSYIQRHTRNREPHKNFCYRHHPDHTNLLPDKYTMDKLQADLESLPKEDCAVISHMWNLFGTASGEQRQIIMRGMLSQCCFPQLSDISTITKDLLRIDFIGSLPVELAFKVLGYLDAKSLCMASMVSKTWQQLANDDIVWYHMCEQHIDRKCTTCGWGLPLLERKRLKNSKRAVIKRLESLSDGNNDHVQLGKRIREYEEYQNTVKQSKTEVRRPWKDIYLERFKIERNWRLGDCVVKDFPHDSPILCLQFDDQYLITGTVDGSVNVWDVETKQLVRKLKGHIRGVSALKFDRCKLVTGSWDQSVRVWNYRTGQCLCTFSGHVSKILCIDFDSNLIAAGSADSTVKVWDFVTKSCFTLRGHKGPVHSVRIHKASRTLFTSSEDCTVLMWCLIDKKLIRAFGGPENGPHAHVGHVQYALPITLEHLEGNEDSDHHILAVPNAEDENGEYSPTNEIECCPTDENTSNNDENRNSNSSSSSGSNSHLDPMNETRATWPTHLLTASLDNTIKLWDIATGKCARTLFGHIEGVWCIAADHFRIVSGAEDKLVKVWDVQSGKCWHTFSGHKSAISCVGLTDTGFASGGDDGLVKLYSFDI